MFVYYNGKVATFENNYKNSQTPLLWAAQEGNEAVARLLLETGAATETKGGEHGWTPLRHAAVNSHEFIVQLLLAAGAVSEANYGDRRTPLSWAAENGRVTVVQLLLAMRLCDVDSKDIQ